MNQEVVLQKSKPIRTNLSIKSERLQKMKPLMLEIAKRIRRAVIEGQPIIIRHHNDADGIISGLCIEHACLDLMSNLNKKSNFKIFRSPSKAPFYSDNDLFRDVLLTKKFIEGKNNQNPLVIVTDNGSTPNDVFGLNGLKILGFETIVIDHHNPVEIENNKTSVDSFLAYHLNPYLFELDGKTSAGMLCYEIARFISENYENSAFPAVSAIADRCDIDETELYIQNTKYDRDYLQKLGTAIEYVSYQLKHDGGSGIYETLFENTEFVNLINKEVQKGFELHLNSSMNNLNTYHINNIIVNTVDVNKYLLNYTYPPAGQLISKLHETIQLNEKSNSILMTLGYKEDMIIVRASEPILAVQTIIDSLKEKFIHANIGGGGHEVAGSIRFVSGYRDQILEEIINMLKNL